MEEFKNILQKFIAVEITIDYGCIGTNYQEILVVENGKIKSIGNFIYRIWRERLLKDNVDMELLEELACQAELYRTGQRDKKPSLAFWEADLKVV